MSQPNRPQIAAVEVDPAGCSYNPDPEHHQDAIAGAVAAEMRKQLAKATAPQVRSLQSMSALNAQTRRVYADASEHNMLVPVVHARFVAPSSKLVLIDLLALRSRRLSLTSFQRCITYASFCRPHR